jgi:hypothetical protein
MKTLDKMFFEETKPQFWFPHIHQKKFLHLWPAGTRKEVDVQCWLHKPWVVDFVPDTQTSKDPVLDSGLNTVLC